MLVGSRCIWLSPGTEKLVPREQCLSCARTGRNPCGYPLPIIQQCLQDRDPNTVQCSATMISGCPREAGIKKNDDWWIDPRAAYVRAHGSLLHLGAEVRTGEQSEVMSEERIREEFVLPDGRTVTVTAQLDIAFTERFGRSCHIVDYKSVASLAPSKLARKIEHYQHQLSIQRWLMENKGYFVESVSLIFLSHDDHRVVQYFIPDVDWFENEENKEFPNAVLLSLPETADYLRTRLPALADSLAGKFAPPLPRGEDWPCPYCDVRDLCEQHYGKPLPGAGVTYASHTRRNAYPTKTTPPTP